MCNKNFFREKRSFFCESNQHSSIFSIPSLQLDEIALQSYLKLGFVPGNSTLFKQVTCESTHIENNGSLKGLFRDIREYDLSSLELKKILLEVFSDTYVSGSKCIVPLSGGMDSRIILAALREFTDVESIHTYTFGAPGAYDYEIANRIAKKSGTKHSNFNSDDTIYTVEGLVRAAIASDGNTEVFHPLVLNRVADHYGPDAIYWSGFAGDVVGGAFGDRLIGDNPKQQLINYEKRGIHFLDGIVDDKELYPYISNGDKMDGYVSESEASFWENHLERYTGHHIFRNDMTIKAPLVDMRLLKFFFTLPAEERKDKKFFNETFSSLFSDVFSIPTKDYGYKYSKYSFLEPFRKVRFYFNAAGWRVAPNVFTHPNTAYIDMRHAINDRPDVQECIDELLADLALRNIVDNERMFKFLSEHRSAYKNNTKDLINLASLEVILKAAKL